MKAFFSAVDKLLAGDETDLAKVVDLYLYLGGKSPREIDYSRFDLEMLNRLIEEAWEYVVIDAMEDDYIGANIGNTLHDSEGALSLLYGILDNTEGIEEEDDLF